MLTCHLLFVSSHRCLSVPLSLFLAALLGLGASLVCCSAAAPRLDDAVTWSRPLRVLRPYWWTQLCLPSKGALPIVPLPPPLHQASPCTWEGDGRTPGFYPTSGRGEGSNGLE